MSQREKQNKFWIMIAKTILFAEERDTPICILEWMRSEEQQRIYVARGSSSTMNSLHLQGLAIDFCFLDDLKDDGIINWIDEKYKPIGEFWESLGGIWGGRWTKPHDLGHIQYNE